ncbi:hypothetical protein WA026_004009 [Henosepilachna vigintioctopunctata]|uniref:Uncharacterized protein n=1 Tax=Henosepilachna vigintioctopunctata TaxID=420089 RepID=A0AAW1U946_9CUCU
MLGSPSYGQGWITQPWPKLGLSLARPRLDYSALVHAWVTIVRPRLDNPALAQAWVIIGKAKAGLFSPGPCLGYHRPRLDYSALVHAWVTIVRPRLDNPTLAQAWVIVGMAKDGFSRPGPSMVNQWHGQGWVKRSGPRVALYRYAKARLPSTGPGSAPLSALGNSCMGIFDFNTVCQPELLTMCLQPEIYGK